MDTKEVLLKVAKVTAFVTAIVLLSSLGYTSIEDVTFFQALYMTVVTLTTTGFGDVVPQTDEGKMFIIFLLLSGMGLVTYSITTIISYIMSIDFSKRRREKMESKILTYSGHTIVCGFGRMGEIICKKLKEEKIKFVVIEKRENLVAELQKLGFDYIEGDAACDDVLQKAGIKKAKVLVSVIDNDSDGLYIALAGRSFNKDLQIIVRANEQSAKKRMLRAGADKVVLPFVMSGLRVAHSVINPAVEDFLNIEEMGQDIDGDGTPDMIQLADLYVTEQSELVGKSLDDIGPQMQKMIIVGIRKMNHEFIFNPRGDYKFELNDCLIALGDQKTYRDTMKKYSLVTYLPNNPFEKQAG